MVRLFSKKLRGSSLVEVMIMMLILSISIVGIYSMVGSGQKLATITDERRLALNLAREGLEGIGNLRDTFTLRSYSPPTGLSDLNSCFFTTNGLNYGACPSTLPDSKYILQYRNVGNTDYSSGYSLVLRDTTNNYYTVCIDQNGWYSQVNLTSDPTSTCTPNSAPTCKWSNDTSCRTKYERFITFQSCGTGPKVCITATVSVAWGTSDDKKVVLEQSFTKN